MLTIPGKPKIGVKKFFKIMFLVYFPVLKNETMVRQWWLTTSIPALGGKDRQTSVSSRSGWSTNQDSQDC